MTGTYEHSIDAKGRLFILIIRLSRFVFLSIYFRKAIVPSQAP